MGRPLTTTRGLVHLDQNVLNTTQNSLCGAVNRRRGRLASWASRCCRRTRFSRPRSSRARKALTTQLRRCPSDTIMARISSEQVQIQLLAKLLILRVYDVLARHNGKQIRVSRSGSDQTPFLSTLTSAEGRAPRAKEVFLSLRASELAEPAAPLSR